MNALVYITHISQGPLSYPINFILFVSHLFLQLLYLRLLLLLLLLVGRIVHTHLMASPPRHSGRTNSILMLFFFICASLSWLSPAWCAGNFIMCVYICHAYLYVTMYSMYKHSFKPSQNISYPKVTFLIDHMYYIFLIMLTILSSSSSRSLKFQSIILL